MSIRPCFRPLFRDPSNGPLDGGPSFARQKSHPLLLTSARAAEELQFDACPMNLDEITAGSLTSPSDLIDLEESLRPGDPSQPPVFWAFRGQSKTFGTLVPSFQRIFTGKKSFGTAEVIEKDLINAFRLHYEKLSD